MQREPTYGVAENVEPSWRERMQMSIYDALGGSISPSDRARANSYSDIASNLVDWIPGAGDYIGINEAYTDFNRGNYGQAAIGGVATTLGAVPIVGDVAAKAVRTAGKQVIRAVDAAEELARRAKTRIITGGGQPFDPRFSPRKGSAPKSSGEWLSTPEQERLNAATFSYEGNPIDVPNVSIADFEGKPFITSMADRTSAGYSLTGINNTQLDNPIYMHGGQDYMFDQRNAGQVWASDPNVVESLRQRAQELKKQTGQDPIMLPWRMSPSGGDYATMTTDAMLEYNRKMLDPASAKKIDTLIREKGVRITKKNADGVSYPVDIKVPDFKGVLNPETAQQVANFSGDQRKAIQQIMDTYGRDAGGISRGEARLAVTDLTQYNAPAGGLQNAGIIYPDSNIILDSGHPTYSAGLAGEGVGRLKEDVMVHQLLPQVVKARGIPDARFPRQGAINDLRPLQMKPYSGIITQSMLRSIFD
tara:strand:- start:2948 stop:4372 length:1425 start_codon:yes stop_codon:yes gene_type:complete